jgi:hypothetical protein
VVERRERVGKIRLTLRIAPQDRARFEQRYRKKIQLLEDIEAKS